MGYQQFFTKIENFETDFKTAVSDSENQYRQAKEKTAKFLTLINANINAANVSKSNPLFQPIQILNASLKERALNAKKGWDNFNTAEVLSKELDDKLIFFVFGKVNAGKSSFSNLFTDLCNQKVQRFHLDETGKVQAHDGAFKIGQTETTAQIQWVEIGSLVLVDSPGLHSMTPKNGELTKKYLVRPVGK